MKRLIFILFALIPGLTFAQAIVKGSGLLYSNGAPTFTPNLNADAEICIDTVSGLWYEYQRDAAAWAPAGFRIQKLAGSSPPSGAPSDKQSEVVLNDVDSLYRWRGGAWRHLNKVLVYTAGTGISVTGTVIANTGDLSATNEGSLTVTAGSGTTSVIHSNTSGSTDVTISASTGLTISESGNTITLTNSAPDQTVSITNGGGVAVSGTYPNFTLTATDQSISNEGSLTVAAGGSNDSQIQSNTSGSSAVVIAGGTNVTVTESGNTITISASGGGGGGITSLNGQTGATQTFATGTTGTDFGISSSGDVHTFNLPIASASNTGKLSSTDWSTFNAKIGGSGTTNRLPKFTGTSTIGNSLWHDNGTATAYGTTSIPSGPRLLISGGPSGANVDAIGTAGAFTDQATFEAEGADYADSVQSVYIQFIGDGGSGSTFGIGNKNQARVILNGINNVIGTNLSNPLKFGINDTIRAWLTPNGFELRTGKTLRFRDADNSNFVEFLPPALSANSTYTWPASSSNGALTNTAGVLSWVAYLTAEVDGSVTNEGSLTVAAGGGNDSQIQSNTSGSSAVVIAGGTNVTVTESGNTITISAASGGTNYQLWRDDGSAATQRANANFVSTADIEFTLTDDSGAALETEVTADIPNNAIQYAEFQQVAAARLLGNPTGSAANVSEISLATGLSFVGTALTPADPALTNEGSLTVNAGSGTTSVISSNTSGSTDVTITASTGLSISESGNTITLTNSAPDQTVTLTNGGGVAVSGTYPNFTLTATDQSVTNEGFLSVTAGGGNSSDINSNTSGSAIITISGGTNVTVTESGNTITIAASSGNSIYVGSGTIPNNTVATLTASGDFVFAFDGGNEGFRIDDANGQVLITDKTGAASISASINGVDLLGGGNASISVVGDDILTAGNLDHGNSLQLSATLSPAQITSNQNNYNPTNLATSLFLRLNSDAARDITGLATGTSGRVVIVHNIGSFNITLKDESGSSTAGNRFALTADIVMEPDMAAFLQYDLTSSRWRCVGVGKAPAAASLTGTGSANHVAYWTSSTNLSFDSDFQFNGTRVGIQGAPVSGFSLYTADAIRVDGTIFSSGVGSNFTASTTTPHLRLSNTTATTGDTWYLGSENDGDFSITSANLGAIQLTIANTSGQVQIANSLRIGSVTGTPTSVVGRNGSGDVGTVSIGSGLSLSGGTLSATVTSAAPVDANYLLVGSLNATLTNDRLATEGNNMNLIDGGANGNFTIEQGTEAVKWTADISPAQFSGQQNNFDPTGWGTTGASSGAAINFSLSGPASLTGLAGGSDGRWALMNNLDSTDPLTLIANSASSSSANRFGFRNDIVLEGGENALIYWSAAKGQWILIGKSSTSDPSVISPSSISSQQDDYNPTGWLGATNVRLNFDPSIPAFSGFMADTPGEEKTLSNVSGSPAVIFAESTSSSASNRVSYSRDFILLPGQSVRMMYDGTVSRWRILDQVAITNGDRNCQVYNYAPGSVTAGDNNEAGFSISGGAMVAANAISGIPGSTDMQTSTSATGISAIFFPKTVNSSSRFGEAHLSAYAFVSIPVVSSGTQRFTAQFAIMANASGTTLAGNNAVGIRYSDNINGGVWEGFTRNNAGTETTVSLGATMTAGSLNTLRIEVNKGLTVARFYINDTFAGQITATMPTSGTACGTRIGIFKSIGTTSTSFYVHGMIASAIYP